MKSRLNNQNMNIKDELIKYAKWYDRATMPEDAQTDEADLVQNIESYLQTEGKNIVLSDENDSPILRVSAFRTRFFFREDDDICYMLQSQIDYMVENKITEMTLFLAEREINSSYFFCKYFGEAEEKSEGGCGKICKGYEARNGKSGACKHYGYTYEQTDRCFTIKLSDELVSQNEC